MRTNTPDESNGINWHLIADDRFDDFEEFNESIKGWNLEFHQLTPGNSSIELLQVGRPEFMLSFFHFEQSYEQTGTAPSNCLTFGIGEEMIGEVVTSTDIHEENCIMRFPSDDEMWCVSQRDFKGYSLSISETLLNAIAESYEIPAINARSARAQRVLSCAPWLLTTLRSSLRLISQGVKKTEAATVIRSILPDDEYELARQLLVAMEGASLQKRIKPTHTKRVAFQRAREYIESNQGNPITVLELAQASGCGVRKLEHAFQEYCNTTPKAYLMSRRLTGVHHDLKHALSEDSTVTEIAGRWGFWHMGQFARDYRRFFGGLPSETLRQERSS